MAALLAQGRAIEHVAAADYDRLAYMVAGITPEIHGYRPHLGYRVFIDKALTNGDSTHRTAHEPPTPAEATPTPAVQN